ncbi:MAG: hypothetical protein WCK47_05595 [bacterium]|nr:hypothetical protein [Candidatus Sumerlaeota bacterium]
MIKKLLNIAVVVFSTLQPLACGGIGEMAQGVAIGERPIFIPEGKSSEPVPDALARSGEILGRALNNQTTTGAKVAAILEQAKALAAQKPAWVTVFCGLADEKARTPDEAHLEALTAIGKTLVAAGARVYFAPSSPSMSAITVANLRIAADASGAMFIDTGTESAGQPYDEVLTRIRKTEEARLKGPAAPQASSTPGEAPPWTAATATTADRASSATTTVNASGTTGAIISMRPPVALKRFDPEERYSSIKQGRKGKGKKPAIAP